MLKRFFRTLTALLLVLGSALPTMGVPAQAALSPVITRIGGSSRIETAALIADAGWESADAVLLASAWSFPDALAGVPLAYAAGAPILLTGGKGSLEKEVLDRIIGLGTERVYILGGTSAVSGDIAAELEDAGCTVRRLSGADRSATAVAIAKELERLTGKAPSGVFLASSANYPDALAAGPAAALCGAPILYIRPDGTLDSAAVEYIRSLDNCAAVVLGGSSAVNSSAEDNLAALGVNSTGRVSGTDRYATAIAVNRKYAHLFTGRTVVAATGTAFPDALAGGSLAAHLKAPMVLLPAVSGSESITSYISELSPEESYVLGGAGAVPDSIANSYLLPPTVLPPATADEQMRAVWIPYLSQNNISAEAIDKMVADCKALGANTIIFHVRPFGDALYDSDYFPWSHVITGTQGVAPSDGFDPLEYIIEQAHANGMELHAWINPLRIQLADGSRPSVLSADNPYSVWRSDSDPANDDWVVDYSKGKFYNPAHAEVRRYIIDGMVELVKNYDIDGIHWDDYFYPAADNSFDDSLMYSAYTAAGGTMTLLEWRTENINILVRDSYAAVKSADLDCRFGISPQGNIGNCLRIGADVYEWCSTPGYIDYICPQVYWTFDNTIAPFAIRCGEWRDMITCPGIDLYIGLALYKAAGTADGGKWQRSDRDIADQILCLLGDGISADGFMLYSYQYLNMAGWEGEVSAVRELLTGRG